MAQAQQRLPCLSAEAVAEGFARSGTQYVLELSNLGLESVASTLEALLPPGVRSLNLSQSRWWMRTRDSPWTTVSVWSS